MVSVAVHPENDDILVVANTQGRVWLSLTGGTTWVPILDRAREGLGELSTDEDVFREVEAFVEDFAPRTQMEEEADTEEPDYVSEDDPAYGLDEDVAAFQEAVETVANDTRTDIQAQPELFGLDPSSPSSEGGPATRVSFVEGGLLVVARGDGLWLSPDLGGSWSHPLEEPVFSVAFGTDLGLWVAGTPDGMRFAVDPTLWIDPEDGTEGVAIFDLAASSEGFFAATSDGVYAAADGQSWERVGPLREAILTLGISPQDPGELWVTTRRGVMRLSEGGEQLEQAASAPLRDPRSLAWIRGSSVVVATSDGPWTTQTGGARWAPLTSGLDQPMTYQVASSPTRTWLAAAGGLYRLTPADQPTPEELLASLPPWVSLEALYDAAGTRLALGASAPVANRALMSAVPTVFATARVVGRDREEWVSSTGDVRDILNRDVYLGVRFVWTPAGRKRPDAIAVVVTDDDVFVDDGADQTLLASRVNRNLQRYQQELGREIADLYVARTQLMIRRPLVSQLSVREQVLHDLQIAEIEAILDALTAGAVSRYSVPG